MITTFEKLEIANRRVEKYKDALKDMAKTQIRAAMQVYDKQKPHKLPTGMKWFCPHDYVEIDLDTLECLRFETMWSSTHEPDWPAKTIPFHPIVLDETKSLEQRYDEMVVFFTELKAKGDQSEKELKLALLAKQKRDLESQLIAIENQLKETT